MFLLFIASMTVIENLLTHEVFKHGLLMSQQVINNGLPSNKANMTGQCIRHRRTDMCQKCTDVFVFTGVDRGLGRVLFSQHRFPLKAPAAKIHSNSSELSGCRYALHTRQQVHKGRAPDSQTIYSMWKLSVSSASTKWRQKDVRLRYKKIK